MWAFRRASVHLRNRGLISGTSRISCVKPEIASCYLESHNAESIESQGEVLDALVYLRRFYSTSGSSKSYLKFRSFSSHAGNKSSSDHNDTLEDALPELDTPNGAVHKAASRDGMDGELISELDLYEDESVSDDIQTELESLDSVSDVWEKISPKTEIVSAMIKALFVAPLLPVSRFLDNWVETGNEVTQTEVLSTMLYLRKRKMFLMALQVSEWLESRKQLDWTESMYASHVDLIAKVHGTFKAEKYIEQIPESFKSEIVYRTLLANYVFTKNVEKAEHLFNKMKNSFPVSCFSCTQLLLLYTKTNRKKILDVLLLMERENIKPSHYTYMLLINFKGWSRDISGMEQVLEKMMSEGIVPSMRLQASLARHYAFSGLNNKTEVVLKEMEGDDITKNRLSYRFLLPIYASIGRADEVRRIWRQCESNPDRGECMAGIEAWGKLNEIEEAEAVFDKLLKIAERPSSRHYAALLNVYANHGMLTKGKALISRMAESGAAVLPVAWNAIVKLYAGAGEVEAAYSILENGVTQKGGRALVTSYLTILDHYANKGDVHNAEKMFLKMILVGYPVKMRSYRSLLNAYINAKAPAYGFRERIRGDNLAPNNAFAGLLAQADAINGSFGAKFLA
ncbi:hypothetical protein C2S51_010604 [Perilla frutescens var. frutescens]|nr:hypothetical protein C2S51_010604 [Perilla frutescens var. frutescens]